MNSETEQTELYQSLARRMGEDSFRRRQFLQNYHSKHVFRHGRRLLDIQRVRWVMRSLWSLLQWSGLQRRGYRNFLNVQVVERTTRFANLPQAFDGFRLLQMSDLHLDFDPALTPVILARLTPLRYDLAVITGDFRSALDGPDGEAIAATRQVIQALRAPALGILGNHDALEFVPSLEAAGLPMLVNETLPITRHGASIYLSGVDDPHYYETDDLPRARASIPTPSFSILLAHSPEIYREASAAGYDWMLCGHTHGGQMCLPGRIPVVINANCPRRMAAGRWVFGSLQGFTSPGTGSSGVPARFNCPPEITLHTLTRA